MSALCQTHYVKEVINSLYSVIFKQRGFFVYIEDQTNLNYTYLTETLWKGHEDHITRISIMYFNYISEQKKNFPLPNKEKQI